MAEIVQTLRRHPWYYQRVNLLLGALLLALAGSMGAVFLTNEEKPQIVSVPPAEKNEGCEDRKTNPLRLCRNADISEAIQKYYKRLAEQAEYVDSYDNLIIYEKNGMLKDTYVVFVTYHLNIRDTYTPVPGLGTFYAHRKTDGGVMLDSMADNAELGRYIARLTEHADTQALFRLVETSYARAVQSDALLAESLKDLQNAAAQN